MAFLSSEPLGGKKDTSAVVNFLGQQKKDVYAVVNFIPIFTAQKYDLTASVNFGGHLNFPASVSFSQEATSDIAASVNFFQQELYYLPATVQFPSRYDVAGFVTFLQESTSDLTGEVNFIRNGNIYSIPASVDFIPGNGTLDFEASVSFPSHVTLPGSITFIQSEELSLPATVTMHQLFSIGAEVLFRLPGNLSLPASVFLGGFHKDISGTVTFNVDGLNDFPASIQIQQVNVQKSVNNFMSSTDFAASMFINGMSNLDTPATVNFRVPPFDFFLPATVVFKQFGIKDFKSSITINNPLLGGGNVPVIVQPAEPLPTPTPPTGPGSVTTPLPTIPPVVANNAIVVSSDATGYFQIINLVPGDYTIVPTFPGVTFNPPAFHVTITNSNVTLNFDASGNLINQLQTGSVLPPVMDTGTCFINQTTVIPGTFTIEGFIKLSPPTGTNYSEVITVITEEDKARRYRDTLGFGYY